jgi:hypothetical protein
MDKVIVERPRYGSRMRGTAIKGYSKRENKLGMEISPTKESMTKRYGYNRKQLNEYLSPLRRYLLSQVGRQWDSVFSEICENIRLDSAVQSHVRDHIDHMVARDIQVIDGKVCDSKEMELYPSRFSECFYVCPDTGILKKTPERNRSFHYSDYYGPTPAGCVRIDRKFVPQVVVDKYHRYLKLEGIWYLVEFKEIPEVQPMYIGVWPTDVILKRLAMRSLRYEVENVSTVWGEEVYATNKRQIGKREIRKVEKTWEEKSKAA